MDTSHPPLATWLWDSLRREYYFVNKYTNEKIYQGDSRVTSHYPRRSLDDNSSTNSQVVQRPHHLGISPYPSLPPPQRLASSSYNSTSTFPGPGDRGPVSVGSRWNVDHTVYTASSQPFRISDSHFHSAGRYMRQDDDEEKLFPEFKVPSKPKKFFKLGKVFLMLWSEPAGESSASGSTVTVYEPGLSSGRYGERVFSKVRRFVIVREGTTYSIAAPIMTYNRQGVSKPGIIKSEHAIVHTSKSPPQPRDSELPSRSSELGMLPGAIRVIPDDPNSKLDDLSRIHFGRLYTIEHNTKVKSFGIVQKECIRILINDLKETLQSSLERTADLNPSLRAASRRLLIWDASEKAMEVPENPHIEATSQMEHTNIQASAKEVINYFRSNGFTRVADEVENAMLELAPRLENRDDKNNGPINDEDNEDTDTESGDDRKENDLQP